MQSEDLRSSEMMDHLFRALEQRQDIGHYGRLVFAMVARHFMDEEALSELLLKNPGVSGEEISSLIRQVKHRDYNPPRRERILEWQAQQEFVICPNPDDPDKCNVYKDLKFPDHIYEHIEHYQEQKAHSGADPANENAA